MTTALQFPVAEQPKRFRKPLSVTILPETDERLKAVVAESGVSASRIVEAALKLALPLFEKSHGAILSTPDGIERAVREFLGLTKQSNPDES